MARATGIVALAWVIAFGVGVFADLASALVALGAGVVVPIGICAVVTHRGQDATLARTHDLSSFAVSLGAPFALASFLLPRGPEALAVATVWLLSTVVVGAGAAWRVLRRRLWPLEELCIDAGQLYLPVGAAWLVAARGALEPMGFREPIVTFTANHFHYAGFAAPVVVGLLGREIAASPSRWSTLAFRVAAPVVLAGIPLVAAGITLSRDLEMPAAILLGFGMLIASGLLALAAARRVRAQGAVAKLSGLGLALASVSLVVSMAFAVAFTATSSAGREAGEPTIPFSTMVRYHGAANALGFALAALLAFAVRCPALGVAKRPP